MDIVLSLAGRTLFATSGGLLGTCIERAKADDLVVLIADVAMPMILRYDRNDHYQIVGPAFIVGMMDGQK
jgi:hypothetical protein